MAELADALDLGSKKANNYKSASAWFSLNTLVQCYFGLLDLLYNCLFSVHSDIFCHVLVQFGHTQSRVIGTTELDLSWAYEVEQGRAELL